MYLSSNLVYLRKKNNLTQKEVGEAIGTDLRNIGHYEKAFREPRLETLMNLAKLYDVTVDDLLAKDMRPEGSLLSQNLKFLRRREKYTQSDMARLLGYRDKSSYCLIENDITKLSVNSLMNLSEFFGITVDDLLKRDLEKEGI